MNWLNLLLLILGTAEKDLPDILALISGIKGASAAHHQVINAAVSAALLAKPAK